MKPATALPWCRIGTNYTWTIRADADAQGRSIATGNYRFDRHGEDMSYIVHACNAYPKLVEAIRTLRGCITETRGIPANNAVENCDFLLRELGEIE